MFNKRKLRYATSSAALTALIIAAIIVFNVIFTALATRYLWYVDLTPETLFTLSDECFDLIEKGDEEFGNSSSPIEMVKQFRRENAEYNKTNGLKKGDAGYRDEELAIEIIFCDEIDAIEADLTSNYVYHTALELQDKFPEYIKVVNHDVVKNPSAVARFKESSLDIILPTHVILSCGSEYRKYALRSFYTFDTDNSDTPWAYNAEKKFAAGILAVTRTDSPVACITTNHGETVDSPNFVATLEDAGYKIQYLDLAKEEIPENCRLIVVCNPKADFMVADGISEVDEIAKLEGFLDKTNSLMVFMSPDTPVLKNFEEEFLSYWGVSFDRHTDKLSGLTSSKLITDKTQSLTADGYTIISNYETTGAGASLTEKMRSGASPKKVIFKNAMPINYSPIYSLSHYTDEEDASKSFDYGMYKADGITRNCYPVFSTGAGALAFAGGQEVGRATEKDPFVLMTVTAEERITQESNYSTINEASYVIACGSTDFLEEALMASDSYGNEDFILSAARAIGQEPVPVGLTLKPFADKTIDTITTADATQYTLVLTILPAVCALVFGVVVLIRRKNR